MSGGCVLKVNMSDYLFQQLKDFGVETVFCVTGGPAAYLMEAVKKVGIESVHCYHEQACAMAADAYARIKKKPAVVLVSNGPGSSNTITGVLGTYQDSIPMIVISGQTPRKQTIAKSGKPLRQFGVQEVDIIQLVESVTKYAVQITDANQLQDVVIKAWTEAVTGRMGPVWLDIPLDIQSESSDFNLVTQTAYSSSLKASQSNFPFSEIVKEIMGARRPLVVAGSGIHLADCEKQFKDLIGKLNIPVVCTWSATDLFNYEDELYIGNFGILGERVANLAIQNSDLLIILGSRMSIPNIGYATELFSAESKKIMIDIDRDEIEKNSLSIDFPVVGDLSNFIPKFISYISQSERADCGKWLNTLNTWKKKFPILNEDHYRVDGKVNSYDFIDQLSKRLSNKDVVVTDMGTSFTCTMQSLKNNGSNRLMTSSACCSMGFGLPGAIGAYYADKSNRTICIAGDGGFQMNIQELQSVVHNKIPLKIFILNSNGYLAISIMQKNLFKGSYFGSTPASRVSAPSFADIAKAYGIASYQIESLQELEAGVLDEVLLSKEAAICEIMISSDQLMIPRVQSQRDSDGQIMSSSIDSMFPYLSEESQLQIQDDLHEI